jgi:hypothetical protein
MEPPLLWHVPLSHLSEKVRWALDYKGIPHRRKVLGPDHLIRARGNHPRLDAHHRGAGGTAARPAALSA